MPRSIAFSNPNLKRIARVRLPLPLPTISQFMAGLSIFGLAAVSFMLGAALIYLQLPPYDFFDQAFRGARAWNDRGRSEIPESTGMAQEGVTQDKADKTCDGF